ncbi:MAG: c-type cytochrome, partial [Nitrospira sp.]|nr:c-type cytochrome [Nitrospira sp.]
VARLSGVWRLTDMRDELVEWIRDERRSVEVRRAAVEGVGYYGALEDRDFLAALAAGNLPAPLRREAIASLARLGEERAADLAAAVLAGDDEGEAALEVVEPFLRRRDGGMRLAEALRKRPPSAAAAGSVLPHLAATGRRDPELAAILEAALAKGSQGTLHEGVSVEGLVDEVRLRGDPEKGRQVFERPALGCASCHAINGGPGKLGPDLGALGTAQNVEFILGAILEPNREVKEGFTAHEFETRDGEVYQGYLRAETASEILYLDPATREERRLDRRVVVSTRQVGSLMPDGLEAGLSRAELRDLVAYLSRLGRRD